MKKHENHELSPNGLQPFLSPLAAWAFSVGTAIGWGSLVVTSTDYLSQAGPLGTLLGLLIGLAMMLMVAKHYHFLAGRYPEAGGLYAYTKNVFGADQAFLVFWSMFLVYISMFWANATSLPVFARYFLREVFSFGYLYSVFGYEVYLGEALVTLLAIAAITLFCVRSRRMTAYAMIGLVLLFTAGITVCFAAAAFGGGGARVALEPAFIPDKKALGQIVRIAFISPWAFIGFENITHSSEEFSFKSSRLFRILVAALVVTTMLYVFVTLLSIAAYPAGCENWLDYISRLDEFKGIEGLPAFYAAKTCLGKGGVYLLMASLLALILTSLIGNMQAISRLCFAVARDGILPDRLARLNSKRVPANAMLLVALVSIPIPFIGRTAIGWIVDVTIIGAAIIYGFVSFAVLKVAVKENLVREKLTGGICLAILLAYMLLLMLPNLFGDYTIGTETYILLSVWPVIGFFYFQRVIRKDHARNFGKAIIVWLSLLVLIMLMAMAWLGREKEIVNQSVLQDTRDYYSSVAADEVPEDEQTAFLAQQSQRLHTAEARSTGFIIALFAMSLVALFANNASMKKWEKRAQQERDLARNVANTDPLTGVKSKHAFAAREDEMEKSLQNGELDEFGIVVCDVNGLKHVNDTLGHKAGDEYIRAACSMLCVFFKHSPVFRIGGDEFVVILRGHDYEHRHEIIGAINEQIEGNLGSGKVVASLGLAVFEPEKDKTFHDVFTRADALMYDRKIQLKGMGAITRD